MADDNWWEAAPLAASAPALNPKHRDLVVRTVLGEAGQEPDDGQAAVAAVIRNRMDTGKWGNDPARVVLAPSQFEPWMSQAGRDRMYRFAPDSPDYQRAAANVDKAFGPDRYDPTNGATHFFSPSGQAALGRNAPAWAQGEPLVIGRHNFYAPEGRRPTEVSAQSVADDSWWKSTPLAPTGPSATPPEASPPSSLDAGSGGGFAPRVAREGMSEPAPPPTGAIEAGARGAAQGVTANFYDELRGLMEAGGLNPKDPASLSALLKGAYGYWTGDQKAAETYDQTVARERGITAKAEADQPAASLIGNMAGAVAVPIGAAAQAPTAAGRAARSAAIGAGFGAASGAGEGIGAADTLSRAGSGAALGGVVGAVASPVLDVAARGGARAVQEAGRYLFPNVEQRAASMVSGAAQNAARVDPAARTRLTPAEAAGTPTSAVADIAGEPGRAVARWAANVSPEARETLNAMVDPRYAGQAQRVVNWLEHTFNFPNATAQREAITQAASAVNNPRYAQAMRDGAGGVWDAELQRLAGAPAVQQAAREAIPSLSNRSITEGFRAPRHNPLTVEADGRVSLTTLPNGNQVVPDLRFWDQVKKNIDAQIGKAEAQGNRGKVQELTALNESLVNHLDQAVPSYGAARAGAAHFFGAGNALQAGQEFVRGTMPATEARRRLAQMTASERQLFQDGFVSRYIQDISRTGDSRNILNKIAESPAAREKLNLVLGPQRANELEAILRVEGVMNLTRSHTQGNSTTARQLVELGAVGSYGGVSAYQTDPQSFAQSLLLGAFVARGRNTDQRVARRVAEMLVSHDPRMFQRGLNMVARNQRLMDGIRGLDQRIGRITGQQSTGVPALQAAGIGRADQEQN